MSCEDCDLYAEEVEFYTSQAAEYSQDKEKLEQFIASEGYVRCDIPACNCGSFHGGHAQRRLSEIANALGELKQGATLLEAVESLVRLHEATTSLFAVVPKEYREALVKWAKERP